MKKTMMLLGAAGLLSACSYSEEKFADDAAAAACDVFVTCFEAYESVDACLADAQEGDDTECVDYDSAAAKDCVAGYEDQAANCPADITEWTPPAACANVCGTDGGDDSGDGGDSGDSGA